MSDYPRDDTGANAHWQAIKCASYLHRATADDRIRMFADTPATTLAHFIEVVTPRIDAILGESNEEGA